MDTNVHQGLPRVSVKKQKKNSPIHLALNRKTLTQLLEKNYELAKNYDIYKLKKLYNTIKKHTKKKTLKPILKHFVHNHIKDIVEHNFPEGLENYHIFTLIKDVLRLFTKCAAKAENTNLVYRCEARIERCIETYLEKTVTAEDYLKDLDYTVNEFDNFKSFLAEHDDCLLLCGVASLLPDHLYNFVANDINTLTVENFDQKITPLVRAMFNPGDEGIAQSHCGFLFYKLQDLNISPHRCQLKGLNNTDLGTVGDPLIAENSNAIQHFKFKTKKEFIKGYLEDTGIKYVSPQTKNLIKPRVITNYIGFLDQRLKTFSKLSEIKQKNRIKKGFKSFIGMGRTFFMQKVLKQFTYKNCVKTLQNLEELCMIFEQPFTDMWQSPVTKRVKNKPTVASVVNTIIGKEIQKIYYNHYRPLAKAIKHTIIRIQHITDETLQHLTDQLEKKIFLYIFNDIEAISKENYANSVPSILNFLNQVSSAPIRRLHLGLLLEKCLNSINREHIFEPIKLYPSRDDNCTVVYDCKINRDCDDDTCAMIRQCDLDHECYDSTDNELLLNIFEHDAKNIFGHDVKHDDGMHDVYLAHKCRIFYKYFENLAGHPANRDHFLSEHLTGVMLEYCGTTFQRESREKRINSNKALNK